MHETTLLKLALICILLGLPALYIITDAFSLEGVVERASGIAGKETIVIGTVVNSSRGSPTVLVVRQDRIVVIDDDIPIPVNATIRARGKGNATVLFADEVRVT